MCACVLCVCVCWFVLFVGLLWKNQRLFGGVRTFIDFDSGKSGSLDKNTDVYIHPGGEPHCRFNDLQRLIYPPGEAEIKTEKNNKRIGGAAGAPFGNGKG